MVHFGLRNPQAIYSKIRSCDDRLRDSPLEGIEVASSLRYWNTRNQPDIDGDKFKERHDHVGRKPATNWEGSQIRDLSGPNAKKKRNRFCAPAAFIRKLR